MSLLDPMFRWGAIKELFADNSRIQAMLDFEAALAHAEASSHAIPSSVAPLIAAKCRVELFDTQKLAEAAALAGNLAIPLVKQLTDLVGKDNADAMRYVHWGTTSQDVIDTGFILQLRGALKLIDGELERLANALAVLAKKHRETPIAGRTWMQHALPTTFGLIAAGWLDAINRHRDRLEEVKRRSLVVQFGGAIGTLAALGDRGLDVSRALGEELNLGVPEIPWHSHRDRIGEVATVLGLCVGTLGKIARDISLHTQTEFAEIFEPAAPGRGGSSTLPQKRNPVSAAVVLAASTRVPGLVSTILSAMVQEEERGLGGWHAEWETMPELIGVTGGALHHLAETIEGLEVDALKMNENLNATHGLIFGEAVQMALAKSMGRMAAHERLEAASKKALAEHRELRAVLSEDDEVTKHLKPADLDRLFNPREYLGSAQQFVDHVLQAHSKRHHSGAAVTE